MAQEITQSVVMFFVSVAIIVLVLLVWSAVKAGSIKDARAHFEQTRALRDWKGATIKVVFVVIMLGVLASLAKADNSVRLFNDVIVFAGVDNVYNNNHSPQCEQGGLDDHLTSNLGVKIHLISVGEWYTYAKYTHHSCVINRDLVGYDAWGIETSVKFNNPLGLLFNR
jgi:heme A synthase